MSIDFSKLGVFLKNPAVLRGLTYLLTAVGIQVDPTALVEILTVGLGVVGAIHVGTGGKK